MHNYTKTWAIKIIGDPVYYYTQTFSPYDGLDNFIDAYFWDKWDKKQDILINTRNIAWIQETITEFPPAKINENRWIFNKKDWKLEPYIGKFNYTFTPKTDAVFYDAIDFWTDNWILTETAEMYFLERKREKCTN